MNSATEFPSGKGGQKEQSPSDQKKDAGLPEELPVYQVTPSQSCETSEDEEQFLLHIWHGFSKPYAT